MRLRELGFFNASLYLCDRLLKRITGSRSLIQRYYFVTQPVTQPMPMPRRLGAKFSIRLIEASDAALLGFQRPTSVIRSRYEQGSWCLALYRGQDLAGFIWLCPTAYMEDEVRCRFVPVPEGAACWDYDLFIVPKYRNSIAFMRLWADAMEFLRSRGISWSASRISAFAPGSLAAHRRMGAVVVGQAIFFVVFGFQVTLSTLSPYVHFSARRGSHPIIHVQPPRDKTNR